MKYSMATNNQQNYSQSYSVSQHQQSNSTLYLCGTCRQSVNWGTKGVLCEAFGTWYHIACQALPSACYSELDHLSVMWTCTSCNSNHHSITSPAILQDNTGLTSSGSENSSLEKSVDSLNNQYKPKYKSSPRKFKPPHARYGRTLRFIYVNCQALPGKKGAWINLLHSTKPDVITATETWLASTIENGQLEYHLSMRPEKRYSWRPGCGS